MISAKDKSKAVDEEQTRSRHCFQDRGCPGIVFMMRTGPVRFGLLPLTSDIIEVLSNCDIMKREDSRLDILQGTLDLLILRMLVSGPLHGWLISERIQQISEEVLRVNQGSLYPALHRAGASRLDQGRLGHIGTGSAGPF